MNNILSNRNFYDKKVSIGQNIIQPTIEHLYSKP